MECILIIYDYTTFQSKTVWKTSPSTPYTNLNAGYIMNRIILQICILKEQSTIYFDAFITRTLNKDMLEHVIIHYLYTNNDKIGYSYIHLCCVVTNNRTSPFCTKNINQLLQYLLESTMYVTAYKQVSSSLFTFCNVSFICIYLWHHITSQYINYIFGFLVLVPI